MTRKDAITQALAFIAFVGGISVLILERRYVNAPSLPDPMHGRIFAHTIKWHGVVYLTNWEYTSIFWSFVAFGPAVGLAVLLNVLELVIPKRKS